MPRCMSCGKKSIIKVEFGNVVLCKKCSALVKVNLWRDRNFSSMEDLSTQKENVLQIANENQFSPEVIREINNYFDEYIEAGFITSINGKAGQTIKIFEDYCIVFTKSETAKEEIVNLFYQFDDGKENECSEEIFSTEDKRNIARSLMEGKYVQTGISVGVTAILKQAEREKIAEKKLKDKNRKIKRLITVGERRIDLTKIKYIETFSKANTANGYMKFVPREVNKYNFYDCEFFFFNNSNPFETKKIKQKIETAKRILLDRIDREEEKLRKEAIRIEEERMLKQVKMQEEIRRQQNKKVSRQPVQSNMADIFEEVKMLKQLLDEGIISDQEFNAKKKDILDL